MKTLKSFLHARKWNLLAKTQKDKENHSPKNSLYIRKCNFLTLRLKNLLYFLKRKLFLYFFKKSPLHFPAYAPKFSLKRFLTFFSKKSAVKTFLTFSQDNFLKINCLQDNIFECFFNEYNTLLIFKDFFS